MDDELSDDEVAERARETARRMLATPKTLKPTKVKLRGQKSDDGGRLQPPKHGDDSLR